MPETAVAQHEALPSIETNPPSPALKARIAHGVFDETALPNMPLPEKVDQKAFDALHNQNVAQRKKDAADFAAANQNPDHPLSAEVLRHNQMQAWSLGIWKEMNDLIDAKQEKVFAIFADPQKLGIPIKPNGNDMQELLKQFYDQSTQKEGSFYQKFCTGNMNEKLANALTLDDMMHLRSFLTKWMLGSDTAFNALVALKTTMDDLESSDPTRKQALSQNASASVRGDLDRQILTFYREGLEKKDEENQPTQSTEQQQNTDRELVIQRKKDVFENEANHSAEAHKKLMSEMINVLEEEKIAGKGKLGATIQETAQSSEGQNITRDGYVVYIPEKAGERVITIGDIHGDLATVEKILENEQFFENMENGNPTLRLVFLGDLVDRGPKSVEVMTAIMKLKTLYKDRVHVIAADHDTTKNTVSSHDFPQKLMSSFGQDGQEIYIQYAQVFDNMPKMVVTGNGVVIVHGGPPAELLSLAQIGRLEDADTDGIIGEQFSWSDPVAHPNQTLENSKATLLQNFDYYVNWAATQSQLTDESYLKIQTQVGERLMKLGDIKQAVQILKNLPPGEYPNPARAGSGLAFDALLAGLMQYDQRAFDAFLQHIGGKVMIRGHQTSDDVDGGQPNLFEDKLWTIHSTGTGSPDSAYRGRELNPSYATFDLGTNISHIASTNIKRVW